MEKEDYCKEITDKSNSDNRNNKNTGKIRGKDQLYGRPCEFKFARSRPRSCILHTGTNNLRSEKSASQIAKVNSRSSSIFEK